jgi:hypothetical protein
VNIIVWLRKTTYQLVFFYQKIQYYLLSIVVVGIADYFLLYELSMSLIALLAVEAIPILIVIFSVIMIRELIKRIKRKMKDKNHYVFL